MSILKPLKIAFFISLTLVAIYGLFVFLTGPMFRIDEVRVSLADEASHSLLYNRIKESLDTRLSKYQGRYVWGVDLEHLLTEVSRDLRIKEVNVARRLPNEIQVTVEPYTPILNILAKDTRYLYPVARDGEVLPKVLALEAFDSPILRGEIFLEDKDLRLKAIELTMELSDAGPLSYRSVSEISYDKKNGFQLRLQSSNLLVWLGFDEFKVRLSRSKRVVEYLQGESMTGRIIDARFSKKVVVRLRNEP